MGVPGLLQSDLCKPHKHEMHLSKAKGKKIAVDSGGVFYLFKYGLFEFNNYEFLYRCQKLIHVLFQYEISPVFVFDGGSPPWKESERRKRSEMRKRKSDIKDEVENELKETKRHRNDIEESVQDIEMLIEIKKAPLHLVVEVIFTFPRHDDDDEPGNDNFVVVTLEVKEISKIESLKNTYEEKFLEMESSQLMEMKMEIVKELSQVKMKESNQEEKFDKANLAHVKITKDDVNALKKLLNLYSIPFIQAQYESDYVFGALGVSVLAKDSDTLWHGCNLLSYDNLRQITDSHTVNLYPIAKILKNNNLTLKQFKELCFCCGTDYDSTGIYNMKIIKAKKAMEEYGCLDNIVKGFIEKELKTIEIIEGKKTCSSEENQEKIKKSQDTIQMLKQFHSFYNEIKDSVVDKTNYNVKWLTQFNDFDKIQINKFLQSQKIISSDTQIKI